MLIFVVPLQSPGASRDWQRVSALACRALASLTAQTSPEFRALLVCNEPPRGLAAHARLDVIRRALPVPAADSASRMADKWHKVRAGLVAARRHAPGHVMVVDADDCVSRRLAGFVAAHATHPGWFVERGFVRDEGSRLVYAVRHGFDARCGTSALVRMTPDELPAAEHGGTDDNAILRGGHRRIRDEMNALGRPLAPLPFAGAVYNVATGENDSAFSLRGWRSKRVWLGKLLRYRPLTDRLRREFGLYEIG